jgi:cyanophycinase
MKLKYTFLAILVIFGLLFSVLSLTGCDLFNGDDNNNNNNGDNDKNEKTSHLFIHGGNIVSTTQRNRFIELAGGASAKILVVLFSPSKDPEEQGPRLVEQFTRQGANADYVEFIQSEADLPQNLSKLDGVTGVWFPGGTQTNLTNRLLGTVFLERIKGIHRNGGVVGGTSAGTVVMSEVMIARDNNGIPVISEGFGFIDFAIIDQHFSQRDRQSRLILAVQGQNLPGIGIDEDTAVIFNADSRSFEVIGSHSVLVYELTKDNEINTKTF